MPRLPLVTRIAAQSLEGNPVTTYFIHSAASTIGIVLAVFIATIPFNLLPVLGIWQPRFIEVFVGYITEPPFFIAFLTASAAFAFYANGIRRDPQATVVWIVPLVVLIFSIAVWQKYPGQGQWKRDVWDNFFGRGCGSSECIYEYLVTLPFYTSVSYSIGAAFALLRRHPLAITRRIAQPSDTVR